MEVPICPSVIHKTMDGDGCAEAVEVDISSISMVQF